LFGDNTTPASVKEALREGGVGQALEAMQDKALKSIDNYYTFTRDSDGSLVFSVREDLDLPATKDEADGKVSREELDDLKPLIELASRRGQLNSSFLAETLNVDQSGRKQKFLDTVTNISALMFHEAEVMNRQVTLITAYDLALKKLTGGKKPTPEQQQQAAEEAIYETQQINGGATLETGPRFAREGVGRVALMYKNYGIQMYYTMLKTANEALDVARASYARDLESKGMKAAAAGALADAFRSDAAKQLAGVHLSALFFAGVQGIPLYGAATMLFDMFFLGDDDEEADFYVRRTLDNEMLYRGLLSELTGFDVAQRVKLTDLLFEADRFNSNPSPEEELAHLAGGPAWSVYSRGRKGIDKIAEGDLVRGIEDLLPGAVRNAMQAVRFGMEGGIRTRRGDFMYDDITAGDLVAKVLGFPPNEYTKAMDETSAAKRMSDRDRAKREKLLKKLYVAEQYGDFEGMDDAEREIDEFNASAAVGRDPDLFVSRKTVKKSLARHRATSATRMHNGVVLPKNIQGIVEEDGFF
jgi:hypothetical protein